MKVNVLKLYVLIFAITIKNNKYFINKFFYIIHYLYFRNDDQWAGDSKNGPSESDQQTYDGPPGMEPDGIIESNWDVVS